MAGTFGPCQQGQEWCRDGILTCSQTVFPTQQLCEGVDNDCDGAVDEDCPCLPIGSTQDCGIDVGLCDFGTKTCTEDGWSSCQGGVGPAPEICDGLDNNCDGATDEGDAGGGAACTIAALRGPCARGVEECRDDDLVCVQTVFAATEQCNDRDDDCDGSIDEGNPGGGGLCILEELDGVCRNGELRCEGGQLGCAQTVFGSPDGPPSACEGDDNDCDGTADEGCTCNDGARELCGTDEGECVAGTRTCSAGSWGACVGETGPSSETCNNRDDNCNGLIDEQVQRACYTFGASTRHVGECSDGVENCSRGSYQACLGDVGPTTEICDGDDNDCDGEEDEWGVWPPSSAHEPNDFPTINPAFLGAYSGWWQSRTVSSTFGSGVDMDYFYWHLANYDDTDNEIVWRCTVSGLASGQRVRIWVGVHTGGYPGNGGWQFTNTDSEDGGNGRWLGKSFPSPQGPYGLGVGVVMTAGFGPCDRHSYTLTCALEHDWP